MNNIKGICWVLLGSMMLTSTACNDEDSIIKNETTQGHVMNFKVWHPSQQQQSRVNDMGFETGDKVGLFITEQSKPLELAGNYVNNATLEKSGNQWNSSEPILWNAGKYNAYSYFPYNGQLKSVDNYLFSLASDQNSAKQGNVLGGYEASDFLWAQKKDLVASNEPVNLNFSHRMSKLAIQLIKGKGFEGEFTDEAEVFIHNTVTDATIDLSAGIVTRDRFATKKTMRAKNLGGYKYAAIVVPQRLDYNQPLIEVIMNGVSYLYESKFIFKPGVQHTINLVISKNPNQIKIEIGGELQNWTN